MSFQFSPFTPSNDESSSSIDEFNTADTSDDIEIKPVCPKCPDIIPSHTHVESFSDFAPVRNYNWILFIVLIYIIGCMMLLSKPSLYKKMNRKYNIVVVLIIGPFYAIYKYLSCM